MSINDEVARDVLLLDVAGISTDVQFRRHTRSRAAALNNIRYSEGADVADCEKRWQLRRSE